MSLVFTLGGTRQGISPKQTVTNYKTSEDALNRRIVKVGWNSAYASGVYNSKNRIVTPFRAVNNSGDFLCRTNYSCGGPNPNTPDRLKRKTSIGRIPVACDDTGVPPSSCNVKFVADSSDYVTYKKRMAVNRSYNDSSFGGDDSNGSYVARMRTRN